MDPLHRATCCQVAGVDGGAFHGETRISPSTCAVRRDSVTPQHRPHPAHQTRCQGSTDGAPTQNLGWLRGKETVTFQEIINLHPRPTELDRDLLLRCIEECLDCAASCAACADACLGESDLPELRRCIRLNLDCADACEATGRIVTRQTSPDPRLTRGIVEAYAVACLACAEECDRHAAHHEHCRFCAAVCRRCKQACDELVVAIG